MDDNFARGRSAEVFQAGDGKVLKLFFDDYPREYAEKEYKNTKIVSELGCISMKVYEKVEKDGRFGFVMDFIDGVSQNDMPSKILRIYLKQARIWRNATWLFRPNIPVNLRISACSAAICWTTMSWIS